MESTILWRRVDSPGHDACRLSRTAAGWELSGAAVFRDDGLPAWLFYRVVCDSAWRTKLGEVSGWLNGREVRHSVARTAEGLWTLDGRAIVDLDVCLDLDFGFTPATNLTQLRRISLADGQAADVRAAWLHVAEGALTRLDQRYERRSATTYWYEASRFGYTGLLEVEPSGFVRRYPGLWEAEP